MMKVIAENLETSEKHEAEVTSLKDRDLKLLETFHFPENKNPEKAIRKHIANQNISADQKAQIWEKLKGLAEAVLQVGKHVLHIGRKIFDFCLHLVTSYPKLTIGLILGAVFGSLIAAIPVIGWIFGGIAKVFLPLIGGYLGYREDLSDRRQVSEAINDKTVENKIIQEIRIYEPLNAFTRSTTANGGARVFRAINDETVKKTIEQEVHVPDPPNTHAQPAAKNEDAQFKRGLDRGIARGAMAMKTMLTAQAESKFGKETAEDLEGLIANVGSLDCLSQIGRSLLDCDSSNEFIQRTSELLG